MPSTKTQKLYMSILKKYTDIFGNIHNPDNVIFQIENYIRHDGKYEGLHFSNSFMRCIYSAIMWQLKNENQTPHILAIIAVYRLKVFKLRDPSYTKKNPNYT